MSMAPIHAGSSWRIAVICAVMLLQPVVFVSVVSGEDGKEAAMTTTPTTTSPKLPTSDTTTAAPTTSTLTTMAASETTTADNETTTSDNENTTDENETTTPVKQTTQPETTPTTVTVAPTESPCPVNCTCTEDPAPSGDEGRETTAVYRTIKCDDVTSMPTLPDDGQLTHVTISFAGFPGIPAGAFVDLHGLLGVHLSGDVGDIAGGAFANLTGSNATLSLIAFAESNVSTVHAAAFTDVSGFASIAFTRSTIQALSSDAMQRVSDVLLLLFGPDTTINSLQTRALSDLSASIITFASAAVMSLEPQVFTRVNVSRLTFDETLFGTADDGTLFGTAGGGMFNHTRISDTLVLANYTAHQLEFPAEMFSGVISLGSVKYQHVEVNSTTMLPMTRYVPTHVIEFNACVIESLSREALAEFDDIKFDGCQIGDIDSFTFSERDDLSSVHFDGGQIATIHADAFNNLTDVLVTLEWLDIYNMTTGAVRVSGASSQVLINHVTIGHTGDQPLLESRVSRLELSYSLLRCMASPYLGLASVIEETVECNKNALDVQTGARPPGVEPGDTKCLSDNTVRPLTCPTTGLSVAAIVMLSITAALAGIAGILGVGYIWRRFSRHNRRTSSRAGDGEGTTIMLPSPTDGFRYNTLDETVTF